MIDNKNLDQVLWCNKCDRNFNILINEKNEVIGTIDEPIDKVLSGKQAVASRSRIKTCEINCHQLLNCQL